MDDMARQLLRNMRAEEAEAATQERARRVAQQQPAANTEEAAEDCS